MIAKQAGNSEMADDRKAASRQRSATAKISRKAAPAKRERAPGLGQRLSAIRKQRGWTLKQVSERTGIATSTLSKVENQRISLTYDNLIKLAVGLNVDVAELFSDATGATNSRRSIARAGSGDLQATANYEYYYLNGDLKNKKMIPIYTIHKCRSIEDFGPFVQHDGEEFIYVLKGTIEVHTQAYSPVRLEEGDGIYIDSQMPHAYISLGDEDAIALGICTSPELLVEG